MKIIQATAVLLLAGCATAYKAPVSGPSATLTFATMPLGLGSSILVQNFDDDDCADSPNGTRLATFAGAPFQGSADPHDGVSRTIPAGRPVVFSFVFENGAAGFTDTRSCTITTTFLPTAGAHYRASFDIVGKTCRVGVRRVDGENPLDLEALRLVEPACVNGLTG